MVFDVRHLFFPVRAIGTQIVHPLQGIIEIAGGENEIDVIVIASIAIGVHDAAGILGAERIELSVQPIDLQLTEVDIVFEGADLAVDGIQVSLLKLDLAIEKIELAESLFFLGLDLIVLLLDLVEFALDLLSLGLQRGFFTGRLRCDKGSA